MSEDSLLPYFPSGPFVSTSAPSTSTCDPSDPSAIDPSGSNPSTSSTAETMSRTTDWRRRVAEGKGKAPRKTYTCRTCGKNMTGMFSTKYLNTFTIAGSGHTQYKGQRYCPSAAGQIPKEEWLKNKREEAAAKKLQSVP